MLPSASLLRSILLREAFRLRGSHTNFSHTVSPGAGGVSAGEPGAVYGCPEEGWVTSTSRAIPPRGKDLWPVGDSREDPGDPHGEIMMRCLDRSFRRADNKSGGEP